jgi:hypothetical protein
MPLTPRRKCSSRTTGRDLDLSLLDSSPPDGTNLREANATLNSVIRENPTIESPVKRYIARQTLAHERAHSEITLLQKENTEQRELLEARKKRTKGKRVALGSRYVFTTAEVLAIVKKSEIETAKKRPSKRRRTGPKNVEIEEEIEEVPENVSSDSDSDCIVVVRRK